MKKLSIIILLSLSSIGFAFAQKPMKFNIVQICDKDTNCVKAGGHILLSNKTVNVDYLNNTQSFSIVTKLDIEHTEQYTKYYYLIQGSKNGVMSITLYTDALDQNIDFEFDDIYLSFITSIK